MPPKKTTPASSTTKKGKRKTPDVVAPAVASTKKKVKKTVEKKEPKLVHIMRKQAKLNAEMKNWNQGIESAYLLDEHNDPTPYVTLLESMENGLTIEDGKVYSRVFFKTTDDAYHFFNLQYGTHKDEILSWMKEEGIKVTQDNPTSLLFKF